MLWCFALFNPSHHSTSVHSPLYLIWFYYYYSTWGTTGRICTDTMKIKTWRKVSLYPDNIMYCMTSRNPQHHVLKTEKAGIETFRILMSLFDHLVRNLNQNVPILNYFTLATFLYCSLFPFNIWGLWLLLLDFVEKHAYNLYASFTTDKKQYFIDALLWGS